MQFLVLYFKLKGKHIMNGLLEHKVTFVVFKILPGMNENVIVMLVPSMKIKKT